MRALALTAEWPVPNVTAAVLLPDRSVASVGDPERKLGRVALAAHLDGEAIITGPEGLRGCEAIDIEASVPAVLEDLLAVPIELERARRSHPAN